METCEDWPRTTGIGQKQIKITANETAATRYAYVGRQTSGAFIMLAALNSRCRLGLIRYQRTMRITG
jgi:hypothetical protein